jgi:hypothetical protein
LAKKEKNSVTFRVEFCDVIGEILSADYSTHLSNAKKAFSSEQL